MFLDPDIGLEVKSTSAHDGAKHVTYGDVGPVLNRMDDSSVLVVYQHLSSSGTGPNVCLTFWSPAAPSTWSGGYYSSHSVQSHGTLPRVRKSGFLLFGGID